MELPCFLDCEASSLSRESYPIEIAWSMCDGSIESYLINVEHYPADYIDWEIGAERVHGLSREYLEKTGKHPLIVAKKLCVALGGKRVITSAPEFDGFWVKRLFDAVGLKCDIDFGHIENVLDDLIPEQLKNDQVYVSKLYKTARKECGLPPHRASHDVAFLIKLYQIAYDKSKALK